MLKVVVVLYVWISLYVRDSAREDNSAYWSEYWTQNVRRWIEYCVYVIRETIWLMGIIMKPL